MARVQAPPPSSPATSAAPQELTSAGIQRTHDALRAAGGGTLYLGTSTYECTSSILIDSGCVSVVGRHATLDYTNADPVNLRSSSAIVVNQQINPAHRHHNATQELSGFILRGNPKVETGILFRQPQDVNGEVSKTSLRNMLIEGFQYGVRTYTGGKLSKFFFVDFVGQKEAAVYRPGEGNSGEGLSFFGCSFSDAPMFLQTYGQGASFQYFGCEFVRPTVCFARVDGGMAEYHSCQFSGTYDNGFIPFVVDTQGVVQMFGGVIDMEGSPGLLVDAGPRGGTMGVCLTRMRNIGSVAKGVKLVTLP